MAAAAIKINKLDQGIFEMVMSYPERRNALTLEMWQAIPDALAPLQTDDTLRALIIRGDGEHFSAGADISEFEQVFSNRDSARELYTAMKKTSQAILDIPVPTIAQMKGACIGGGCAVAMACDIRFADDTAKFALPPARLGLLYPYSDMKRLVSLVGLSTAKDLLFSARLITSDDAQNLGLVNRCFPSTALEQEVLAYAKGLISISGYSQKKTKAIFKAIEADDTIDKQQAESIFLEALDSSDFAEGFAAFLEKRKPQF